MESKAENCNGDNDKKENCPICLADLSKDEQQTLTCGHKFHRLCVQQWFNIFQRTMPRCPLCRTEASFNDFDMSEEIRQQRIQDNEFYDFDVNLNDLFGVFETNEGENVTIYESPIGIVMIQTLRVPTTRIPQGLRVVALPTPNPSHARHRSHRRYRRYRRRGRTCRWIKSKFTRLKQRFGFN